MKKFLLSLIALLSVTMGAWAASSLEINTSTKIVTITVSPDDAADLSDISPAFDHQVDKGGYIVKVVTETNAYITPTAITNITNGIALNYFLIKQLDLSDAIVNGDISEASMWGNENYSHVQSIVLPSETSLPDESLLTFSSTSKWNSNNKNPLKYVIIPSNDGTEITLYITAAPYTNTNPSCSIDDLSSETYLTSLTSANEVNLIFASTITNTTDIENYIFGTNEGQLNKQHAFDGVVTDITGGEVQSGVTTALNGKDKSKVKNLTITSGTLTSGTASGDNLTDVEYICSLTGLTTLDISGATASAEQIFTLLSSSSATTITLTDAQKSSLKALEDKTFTAAMLAKIGMSASDLMSGMTTKNFIIDGATLYVTGTLTDADLTNETDATSIAEILDANTGITTVDVSKCTNNAGIVTITDEILNNAGESTQVTTVSLPGNEYITYNGTKAIQLANGALEIKIGTGTGEYASLTDAIAENGTIDNLLDGGNITKVAVTGALSSADLTNMYQLGNKYGAVKNIDLSGATLASGAAWSNMNTNSSWGSTGVNVFLPYNTDVTALSTITTANLFSESGSTMKVKVNVTGGLANAADMVNSSMATTIAVTGNLDATAVTALASYTGKSILDLTAATTSVDFSSLSSAYATILKPISDGKLTVTGALTNDVLTAISGTSGITKIDFSGVTSVAEGIDWTKLTGPSTVEYVMLPGSQFANVSNLSTDNLTSLKAAGAYNNNVGYAHVYANTESNETGALPTLSSTFPKNQNNNNVNAFAQSGITKMVVTGSLAENDNKFATVTNAPVVDLSGATLASTTGISFNAADVIVAPNLTAAQMEGYVVTNVKNVYSKTNSTTLTAVVGNTPANLDNANNYLDGATTLVVKIPSTNLIGLYQAGLTALNSVNVQTLDLSGLLLGQNKGDVAAISNTHISSLILDDAHFAYDVKHDINISGCTSLTSVSAKATTMNRLIATNMANLTEIDVTEAVMEDLPTTVTDQNPATSETAGIIDVTGTYTNSDFKITADEEFNILRVVPTEAQAKVEKTVRAYVEISVAGGSDFATNIQTAINTYNAKHDPDTDEGHVKVLHVTGELTVGNINEIKTNMPRIELLDLQGVTSYGQDFSVSTISSNIPTATAIILPTALSNKAADVYALQHANFDCVGYFTGTDRLSVYAKNEKVGRLAFAQEPEIVTTTTGMTFLPTYSDGNGTIDSYYLIPDGNFLSSLGTLDPYAIDLTWMNISDLGTDFSSLNDNTQYLVIPQNTSELETTRNQITYNNDFTAEDDGSTRTSTDSYKYYKYNSHVIAVSTYKGTASPYATFACFGGEIIGTDNGQAHINKTANMTYVRKAGELGSVIPYMSELQKNADLCAIAGTINNTDVAQSTETISLSDITSSYLDLTRATLSGVTWSAYTNNHVKYIAMPYGYNTTLAGFPTMGTCNNLEGIGTFVKSDETITESTSKKGQLVYKAYKENALGEVLLMIQAVNLGSAKHKITSLTVGGPVCARDISNRANSIDSEGHLMTTTAVGGKMTAETKGTSGSLFNYTVLESWDLTYATLPSYSSNNSKSYAFKNTNGTYSFQNDLCFDLNGGMLGTVNIKLPISNTVWRLPNNSFANNSSVFGNQSICIPGNYKEFGAYAFTSDNLKSIYTTEIDKNGNGYPLTETDHIKDMGDFTCTLPPSLTKIENGVFFNNEHFTDVYITTPSGQPTPECWKDAFSAGTTYGWGGFNNVPPITKDDYVRSSEYMTKDPNSKTFGILHWPSGCTVTEVKRYTDITREYHIQDQLQTTDADGNVYVWPNQTDYNRAFATASNGYLWNGYPDKESYDNQDDQAKADALYSQTGKSAPAEIFYSPTTDNYNYYGNTGAYTTKNYDKTIYDKDYRGWHQFVLTGSANTVADPDPVWSFSRYNQNDWYTICLPFDMNEDEVCEVFGATGAAGGTDVYDLNNNLIKHLNEGEKLMPDLTQLYQVERNVETKKIVLWFTPNICDKRTINGKESYYERNPKNRTYVECVDEHEDPTNNTSATTGKKILIKAGYPYHIKPYLPGDVTQSPSTYARLFSFTKKAYETGYRDYDNTLDSKVPYKDWVVESVKTNGGESGNFIGEPWGENETERCKYLFIGTYEDVKMIPMYAYFLANNGSNNVWYYNYWKGNNDEQLYTQPWKANTCIIVSHQENIGKVGYFRNKSVAGATSYRVYFKASSTATKFDDTNATMESDDMEGFSSSRSMAIATFDGINEDNDETTEIIRIEEDGRMVTSPRGNVYTVNGQKVRENGTLEGLKKGIYVINGKKYVVK